MMVYIYIYGVTNMDPSGPFGLRAPYASFGWGGGGPLQLDLALPPQIFRKKSPDFEN